MVIENDGRKHRQSGGHSVNGCGGMLALIMFVGILSFIGHCAGKKSAMKEIQKQKIESVMQR